MILDLFGKPVPIVNVRRTVGFVQQTVEITETEPVTGIAPGPAKPEKLIVNYDPIVGA